MKLIHIVKFSLLSLVGMVMLIACNNDEKVVISDTPKNEVKNSNPNPFPFYKNIEIKPGLSFEVLSWGKGVDSVGGYLLLMSDSVKNNYKSISVERKGIIVDAWNMDLDNDGNPEIYVQYVVRKNVNDINVYEFAGNDFDKISFPNLNNMKNYEGNDRFFIKNGDLMRAVPILTVDSGKTTTQIKTLKYNLRGNSFAATEIKE